MRTLFFRFIFYAYKNLDLFNVLKFNVNLFIYIVFILILI